MLFGVPCTYGSAPSQHAEVVLDAADRLVGAAATAVDVAERDDGRRTSPPRPAASSGRRPRSSGSTSGPGPVRGTASGCRGSTRRGRRRCPSRTRCTRRARRRGSTRRLAAPYSVPETGISGWKNRPWYRSGGGKYMAKRASVPSKPPCTKRWRTGSSRHSSTSMYGVSNSGSFDPRSLTPKSTRRSSHSTVRRPVRPAPIPGRDCQSSAWRVPVRGRRGARVRPGQGGTGRGERWPAWIIGVIATDDVDVRRRSRRRRRAAHAELERPRRAVPAPRVGKERRQYVLRAGPPAPCPPGRRGRAAGSGVPDRWRRRCSAPAAARGSSATSCRIALLLLERSLRSYTIEEFADLSQRRRPSSSSR